MTNYSPYGSTPGAEYFYDREKYASPSATPSPRGYFGFQTPHQRPATRAHFRQASGGYNDYSSPRPPTMSSPRYNSQGDYATFNVSGAPRSSRKHSFSSHPHHHKRERRSSYSFHRTSDPHGESDEDEYVEVDGVTYVLPARSRSKRYRDYYYDDTSRRHRTDHYYYAQSGQTFYTRTPAPAPGYDSPRQDPKATPRRPSTRRASTSAPQRPSTARPSSSHRKEKESSSKSESHRKATEADAKKHRIPTGYSLKNWDPDEEPIILLGSVFDANSLGKWIYDWTVYHHGPATPISDMAGDMWLLLIQLAGKVKRAEETMPRIRTAEDREMVDDFIGSGERLTERLRNLLKTCESPMLKASKAKKTQLGRNAGVEFVETLFGRERELEKSEKFMQAVRLWNLRFDANCEEILKNPTK